MARRYTESTVGGKSITISWAAGMHRRGSPDMYMFRDLAGKGTAIAVGREDRCQIQVKDPSLSGVHALIEQLDDERFIIMDSGSTNGVLLDGNAITRPTVLTAATRIDMGRVTFIAVDEHGMVPLLARTVGELCHLAIRLWGNPTEAARHLDVTRAFIQEYADKWHEQGALVP